MKVKKAVSGGGPVFTTPGPNPLLGAAALLGAQAQFTLPMKLSSVPEVGRLHPIGHHALRPAITVFIIIG